MNERELLISSYLNESDENFYLSVGRVIAASEYEVYKAGVDDEEKLRSIAQRFFEEELRDIREMVCEDLNAMAIINDTNTITKFELAVIIAEIIDDLEYSPIPISIVMLAVWFVKVGIKKLCQ